MLSGQGSSIVARHQMLVSVFLLLLLLQLLASDAALWARRQLPQQQDPSANVSIYLAQQHGLPVCNACMTGAGMPRNNSGTPSTW